jgi:NAD(P)-dependent dehydrogenase (short-subunit alcohol dehydrogenase family)
VNALCPLLSGTGLFEQFVGVPYTDENMKKFLFNVPLGRLTDPNDIANVCAFLASDEGRFVTGVNLEIDGGRAVGA